MRKSTKAHLINKYNSIIKKTNATCLKYCYQYNEVNVNVYFDAFDAESVVLSIVLTADDQYYYTPLNILNTGMKTEYLSNIPPQILGKILVNNSLDEFYIDMERHLLQNNPYIIDYSRDKCFVNTIRHSGSKLDLPFWSCLRKVPMSDDTLYKLSARADITLETLQKIQRAGFTLVRTADPGKRKKLTLILEKLNARLS